jgi:periplasmic divalent cation tolerance protein
VILVASVLGWNSIEAGGAFQAALAFWGLLEMDAPFCMAITTVATEAKAREIAHAVLAARLAACVQLHPIQSHYVWKGQLCEDAEIAMHFKMRSADFAALQALVRQMHEYETPEILRIDVAEGDAAYLEWLANATKK